MATYYIDYDAGDDAANGTTDTSPWQHCPGDGDATGVAAAKTPAPDDVFLFKGGVNYKGWVNAQTSGTSGSPITYKGDGWGTPKAHFDGSVPQTNLWTLCANAGECYGNANYASIWYADVEFVGQTALNQLILNDEFLPFAQDVKPPEPIWWDLVHSWTNVPLSAVSEFTLTDATRFDQTDTAFWTGAKLAIHIAGNAMKMVDIVSFDPATDTITHSGAGTSFTDPTPYSVIGHPIDISAETEYAVMDGKIYFYAPSDPNALDISIGKSENGGVTIDGEDYNIVDGFKCSGMRGGFVSINGSGPNVGNIVRNNDCKNNFDTDAWSGARNLNLTNVSGLTVSGNTISQCLGMRGMVTNGTDVTVSGNTVNRTSRTGIYFAGVTTGTISGNLVAGVRGTHGNGISVYQDSSGVDTYGNVITECGGPITYEESADVAFYNNFIDCTYGGIDEWGNMKAGYVRWHNNTIVNHPAGLALNFNKASSSDPGTSWDLKNNIVHGMSWQDVVETRITRENNVWTAHADGYEYPAMGAGSFVEEDYAVLFADSENDDYSLAVASPAIGRAADLSAYFTTDIDGTTRTVPWDIGAYEYGGTAPPTTPPNPPTDLTLTAL